MYQEFAVLLKTISFEMFPLHFLSISKYIVVDRVPLFEGVSCLQNTAGNPPLPSRGGSSFLKRGVKLLIKLGCWGVPSESFE